MSVTRFAGFVGMSVTRFALSDVAEHMHFDMQVYVQLIGSAGMPVIVCSLSDSRCYSYEISRVHKVRGLHCSTTSGTGGLGYATGP